MPGGPNSPGITLSSLLKPVKNPDRRFVLLDSLGAQPPTTPGPRSPSHQNMGFRPPTPGGPSHASPSHSGVGGPGYRPPPQVANNSHVVQQSQGAWQASNSREVKAPSQGPPPARPVVQNVTTAKEQLIELL